MADVTVYGLPPSTFTRTVRMALHEKGVPYNLQPVEMKGAEHLELQPFGKIPAMRHKGALLYETTAITHYIDAAFDGPPLQPADPMGRMHSDRLASIACDYLYASAIRGFVLQHIYPSGPDGALNAEAIAKGKADIRTQFGILDRMLADTAGRHMVGDAYTLGDMFVVPILFWVDRMPEGSALLAEAPRLKAAYDAAATRPSFTVTIPQIPGAAAAAE